MAAPPAKSPARPEVSNRPTQARTATGNSIHTAYLNASSEIAKALKILRDQRAPVQLRFDGDDTSYTAKILDLAGSEFLLEDIHPRSGLSKMAPGTEFSLSSRAQGIYVHSGSNRVVAVESERGVPFFRIVMPSTLLYQQRRRAARFKLPMRVAVAGASVEMMRPEHDKDSAGRRLSGRIIDISAGGCRADFVSPVTLAIEQNEEVRCRVEIPNMLNFEAQATIRHSNYDMGKRMLSCGIELIEMQVTDRRRLEQFIESIRRSSDRG